MEQERTKYLTPAQARVLTLLRLAAGEGGLAEVSKADIARTLSLNVKTVDRAMTRLRSEGYVEAVPRHDSSGGQLANAYRVLRTS